MSASNLTKRKKIFDDDHSPIREVQKYIANPSQPDLKQMIEQRKQKIQKHQIKFSKEQIEALKEFSLSQLNNVAQYSAKLLDKIKVPEIHLDQQANEYQKRIVHRETQCNSQLQKIVVNDKIDVEQLKRMLSTQKNEIVPIQVQKLTHDGFLEQCQAEIRDYEQQLTSQLQFYKKQLQPPSDLQTLNSMLDSVGTDDIQCQMLELDRKMSELQKQLIIVIYFPISLGEQLRQKYFRTNLEKLLYCINTILSQLIRDNIKVEVVLDQSVKERPVADTAFLYVCLMSHIILRYLRLFHIQFDPITLLNSQAFSNKALPRKSQNPIIDNHQYEIFGGIVTNDFDEELGQIITEPMAWQYNSGNIRQLMQEFRNRLRGQQFQQEENRSTQPTGHIQQHFYDDDFY